jgi:hypothetical protein
VLVEINDEFVEQSQGCTDCLKKAGLTLLVKRHSQMIEDSHFSSVFNQIWSRGVTMAQ